MKLLALILSLPTENATARQRAWRSLKASGAAVLRDGVYLMPEREDCRATLDGLASDVRDAGGAAHVLRVEEPEGANFTDLFDRGEDYAAVLGEVVQVRNVLTADTVQDTLKQVRKLRKAFASLVEIDFSLIPGRSMPSSSCHTVLAESFFRRNAELFRPHLAAVGLREQILSAPESEIPVTKYVALWEVLGSEVSPTIGLEVAMRTESSEFGAYGHAIRCAPSMQLVLRSLSRFMVVLTQATQLDFEDNGKRISLAYRVTDASIVQRRQDAEFTICTILNLLREVTRNPQLSPVRVDFEHRAPSDLASHREVFGCPIRFEQPDNRLYFSRELLDMPIRTADQRLFQALEPFLEQQRQSRAASTDVLSQVAHHIASSLSSGCASLEQVASDLKIGVRTLQRRLAEQNVEFSQLVEDVRRSLAESYVMQSDYSLTEIALLLGYSEASSFCRAFRRWTQLTPQQFRQRGRS